MLSVLFQFAIQNLLYLALHLENGSAFPKQLSKKEEQECLNEIASGSECARNKLIVHNLRLVSLKKNIIALKPSIYRHYNVFFVKSQGVFNFLIFSPVKGRCGDFFRPYFRAKKILPDLDTHEKNIIVKRACSNRS